MFMATKQKPLFLQLQIMKKQLWWLFKSACKYFLHFELFACNINTKKIKPAKNLKITWNKFSKVFIRIPGTYKKPSRSHRHANKY